MLGLVKDRNLEPEIIYLKDGDTDPQSDSLWILIEEDESGEWYGTGFGKRNDGEDRVYVSTPESDRSLTHALDAAVKWALSNAVTHVYVRRRKADC